MTTGFEPVTRRQTIPHSTVELRHRGVNKIALKNCLRANDRSDRRNQAPDFRLQETENECIVAWCLASFSNAFMCTAVQILLEKVKCWKRFAAAPLTAAVRRSESNNLAGIMPIVTGPIRAGGAKSLALPGGAVLSATRS